VEVRRYPDARAFLERAGEWLLAAEAEHNSILGDAYLLLSGEHPFREPIYLSTVEHEGRIVACASRPPPDGLTLTAAPTEAIELLAVDVAATFNELPLVNGPEREATEFARLWSEARECAWSLSFEWRWYVLDRMPDAPRSPSGALRLAGPDDRPLIAEWAAAYAQAVRTIVDVGAFFERRMKTRSLFLWDDGGPRSLVAVSGLTPSSARISAVYTPPEARGNGYAGAAVAEVSGSVLEAGRRMCVLFADRTDPGPNAIYMRIGYRPVQDTVGITFESR
jgi:uncharacterized protein